MKLLLNDGAGGTGGQGGTGDGGNGAPPAWYAVLKDEGLRGDATVTGTPDLDTFVKRAIETKAMVGKKAYDLPRDDWKPEQWKEWNKTIGVPDTHDKYAMPDAEMMAKAGLTPEVTAAAMKRFHELGLTPRQTKALFNDWYVAEAAKGADMQAQERQSAIDRDIQTLKQEYGDKYDAKIGLLNAFLKKFGNDDLTKWANESGAGNNPGLVRALVKAGEAMLESSALGGNRDLGPEANKAAAMKEIDAIMAKRISDPAFAKAFNDPKSAERQRWDELHSLAYPKPV